MRKSRGEGKKKKKEKERKKGRRKKKKPRELKRMEHSNSRQEHVPDLLGQVKETRSCTSRSAPISRVLCTAYIRPSHGSTKLHNSALLTEGRYVDICWLLDRPLASAIQSLVRLFRRFFFRIFLCPVHIAGFIISSPYTNDTRVPGLTEV